MWTTSVVNRPLLAVALLLTLGLEAVADETTSKTREIGPRLRIRDGIVEGARFEGGAVFKNIPFAKPPVGDLRWRPPQPIVPWKGYHPGQDFGPSSPQPPILQQMYGIPLGETSEDHLQLNVWTTAGVATKLPVMVWIHGGGFALGGAPGPVYDGIELARRGIVVVTINYRLGPFGFLAHPALSAESEHGSSGNYGLLDQIAALRWVQENIASFGGDKRRVTIFGESAGAASVGHLMASPLAQGLFHRAVMQSGTPYGYRRTLAEAEAHGEEVAEKLGCAGETAADALACMRSKSADELLAVAPRQPLGRRAGVRLVPIVDGWVLPEPSGDVFDSGRQHDVPLIIGVNADEGTIFIPDMAVKTVDDYETLMKENYGDQAAQVLELYPVAQDTDVHPALNASFTHGIFTMPSLRLARSMAKIESPVYFYHFTRVRPGFPGSMLGAFHASEIPFVFNIKMTPPADDTDIALTRAMHSYWVQFAALGDPNHEALPAWPAFDAENGQHLELGDEIKTGQGLCKKECGVLEEIAVRMRENARAVGSGS